MSWIPFSIWREGDGPLCVAFACEIPSGSNLHLIFLRQVFCDLDRAASSFFPRDGRGVFFFFLRKSNVVDIRRGRHRVRGAAGSTTSLRSVASPVSNVASRRSQRFKPGVSFSVEEQSRSGLVQSR